MYVEEALSTFFQVKVAAVVLVYISMLDTMLGRVYCEMKLEFPLVEVTSGVIVMLYKVPGVRPGRVISL